MRLVSYQLSGTSPGAGPAGSASAPCNLVGLGIIDGADDDGDATVLDVGAACTAGGRRERLAELQWRGGSNWWLTDAGRNLLADIAGSPSEAARRPLPRRRLLPAVPRPGKILAVGRNYGAHLEEGQRLWAERGRAVVRPPFPSGFVKVASALAAHGDPIVIPPGISTVDYEIELAVIIGRPARNVPVDRALDYVAGYTIANDVAARELQIPEMEQLGLLVSKNFPSFAPLGPWVVTADEIPDPQDLQLTLHVNGEVRQQASTADMLFSVAEVIADWSRIGLDPGDVILTGTPAGVALSRPDPAAFYLKPGDEVAASISHIGTLENHVVSTPASVPAAPDASGAVAGGALTATGAQR